MEETQPAVRNGQVGGAPTQEAPRPDLTSMAATAGDTAAGALSSASTHVQERATAVASAAVQSIDSARAGVGRITAQAVDTAATTASDASAIAKRTAATVAAQAQQTGIEASRSAQTTTLRVKEVLEAQIKAYPGPVLAGAAVVGFILGRIV